MIELGNVSAVNSVSGKTIVTVVIINNTGEYLYLKGAAISFNDAKPVFVQGYKWWPERREIDLLFNDIRSLPEIDAQVWYIPSKFPSGHEH